MALSDLRTIVAQSIATFVEAIGVASVVVGVVLACYQYLAGLVTRMRPYPPEGFQREVAQERLRERSSARSPTVVDRAAGHAVVD